MNDFLYVHGQFIYNAAVAGAKAGFNRSTEDYLAYELALQECYAWCLSCCTKEERRKLNAFTGGSWQKARLPLGVVGEHNFIAGQPAKSHMRVFLANNPAAVFDIPLAYWHLIEHKYSRNVA